MRRDAPRTGSPRRRRRRPPFVVVRHFESRTVSTVRVRSNWGLSLFLGTNIREPRFGFRGLLTVYLCGKLTPITIRLLRHLPVMTVYQIRPRVRGSISGSSPLALWITRLQSVSPPIVRGVPTPPRRTHPRCPPRRSPRPHLSAPRGASRRPAPPSAPRHDASPLGVEGRDRSEDPGSDLPPSSRWPPQPLTCPRTRSSTSPRPR